MRKPVIAEEIAELAKDIKFGKTNIDGMEESIEVYNAEIDSINRIIDEIEEDIYAVETDISKMETRITVLKRRLPFVPSKNEKYYTTDINLPTGVRCNLLCDRKVYNIVKSRGVVAYRTYEEAVEKVVELGWKIRKG